MTKTPIAFAILSVCSLSLALAAGAASAAGEYSDDSGMSGPGSVSSEVQPGGSTEEQVGLKRSFLELDSNLDGVISKDEAAKSDALDQHFSEADSNQDGSIDSSEFSAFEAGSGSQNESDMEGAANSSMEQSKQLPTFSELDTDTDGQISQTEAQNSDVLSQRFSEADLNRDGNISQAEFSAFETELGTPSETQQPGVQPKPSDSDMGTEPSSEGMQ